MKSGDQSEEIDKYIYENKKKIKLLSDINSELVAKRNCQSRIQTLKKETEDLERELHDIKNKVESTWMEKIKKELKKREELEKEWKHLLSEIETKADTPGYQQAIKHTDVQGGQFKHDIPSTRSNYKNMANRLQNEIKSLQKCVHNAKLKLIDEIKKKSTLEEEVRELRMNVSQKRAGTPTKYLTGSIPDLNLQSTITRVK